MTMLKLNIKKGIMHRFWERSDDVLILVVNDLLSDLTYMKIKVAVINVKWMTNILPTKDD